MAFIHRLLEALLVGQSLAFARGYELDQIREDLKDGVAVRTKERSEPNNNNNNNNKKQKKTKNESEEEQRLSWRTLWVWRGISEKARLRDWTGGRLRPASTANKLWKLLSCLKCYRVVSCRANRPPLALALSCSGRTNGSYL